MIVTVWLRHTAVCLRSSPARKELSAALKNFAHSPGVWVIVAMRGDSQCLPLQFLRVFGAPRSGYPDQVE